MGAREREKREGERKRENSLSDSFGQDFSQHEYKKWQIGVFRRISQWQLGATSEVGGILTFFAEKAGDSMQSLGKSGDCLDFFSWKPNFIPKN